MDGTGRGALVATTLPEPWGKAGGRAGTSASAAVPTPGPRPSNLWEVAVGLGAAAEALLVTQAVVEGRLHHVTRVDLAHRDVVLLRQAAHQVLGVAHELGWGRGDGGGSAPASQAREAPSHRTSPPWLRSSAVHTPGTREAPEGKPCSDYRHGPPMHLPKAEAW